MGPSLRWESTSGTSLPNGICHGLRNGFGNGHITIQVELGVLSSRGLIHEPGAFVL